MTGGYQAFLTSHDHGGGGVGWGGEVWRGERMSILEKLL
jgi:hypothetical protein